MLFVACTTVIPIAFSAILVSVPIMAVAQTAALYALLFGALALLCSALVNRDGPLLILVLILASTLQGLDRAEQLGRALGVVADLLPPIVAANAVRAEWLAGRAADAGELWLVIGYAVAMLVATALLIHRRPLVR